MANDQKTLEAAKLGLSLFGALQEQQRNARPNVDFGFSVSSPKFSMSAQRRPPETDALQGTINQLEEIRKQREKVFKEQEALDTVLQKNDKGRALAEMGLQGQLSMGAQGTQAEFGVPKKGLDLSSILGKGSPIGNAINKQLGFGENGLPAGSKLSPSGGISAPLAITEDAKQKLDSVNSTIAVVDSITSMLEGSASGKVFGELQSQIGEFTGGEFNTDGELVKDFSPAVAVSLYKDLTGDNRINNDDAKERGLPLLPQQGESRKLQKRKAEFIKTVLEFRRKRLASLDVAPLSYGELINEFIKFRETGKTKFKDDNVVEINAREILDELKESEGA